jgi:hypothetical protein
MVLLLIESTLLIVVFKNNNDETKSDVQLTPATIRGKVLTDLGDMLMANIIVEESDGKTMLYTTNVLSGYEIELPEGEYKLHYTRGMQYSTVTKTIKVENFKNYYLEDIRLVELYNSEKKYFYPGDLHQHTVFSDGTDSVEALARASIAAGLSWSLLSDHNDNTGISEWMQTDRLPYAMVNGQYKFFTPIPGVEITTAYGHFQSIGNSAVVEQWDIDLDQNEINISLLKSNYDKKSNTIWPCKEIFIFEESKNKLDSLLINDQISEEDYESNLELLKDELNIYENEDEHEHRYIN